MKALRKGQVLTEAEALEIWGYTPTPFSGWIGDAFVYGTNHRNGTVTFKVLKVKKVKVPVD